MTKKCVFTVEAGTVQSSFTYRVESVWPFFYADFLVVHLVRHINLSVLVKCAGNTGYQP